MREFTVFKVKSLNTTTLAKNTVVNEEKKEENVINKESENNEEEKVVKKSRKLNFDELKDLEIEVVKEVESKVKD